MYETKRFLSSVVLLNSRIDVGNGFWIPMFGRELFGFTIVPVPKAEQVRFVE